MTTPEPATAAELQQEIERTRERLGETVEELAAKADVKARARAKAAEMSGRIRRSQFMQPSWPLALAAAGAVVMGVAVVVSRRQT